MKALRLFFTLLYRRTPAALLVLLVVQLVIVGAMGLLLGTVEGYQALALWFQIGFCIHMGSGERYQGRITWPRISWWTLREALFWPLVFYRHYKGQGA